MSQRTQNPEGSSWGTSHLSSRVAALLAAARHGPFTVQAKKAVKLLQAPTAHVRSSGLHKLKQLLLQFRHLHKERQVALELLMLVLEHGVLSGADAYVSHAAAVAEAFSREQQLPCAAFLQPPAAAVICVQPAAASASAAAEELLRLACRNEALGCLIDLIAHGALGPQQLIDALHARLAAAGSSRAEHSTSSSSSSTSSEQLLPPKLQLLLVQRLLELALKDNLLPPPSQQPQDEQQEQQQQLERQQQAASILRDALIRIHHFCPRVCLAAVEAVSCVMEAATQSSSSSSSTEAIQCLRASVFGALLEPTLVVSMQLLLSCSSSSAAGCSLVPLAVTRLLRCVDVLARAELQLIGGPQQHQQYQQQRTMSDRLLQLSMSALLRVEDVGEFSCCFSAALQSAQLSAASIAALQQQHKALPGERELWVLLQQQKQQQQARADRLLWECACRLYTAREQMHDPVDLLQQLLRCLEFFSPLTLNASPSGDLMEGSCHSSNDASCTRSCLSIGLWRITCATVGWLLWSAAPNESSAAEMSSLLDAVERLLQLQPQLAGASSSSRSECSPCCTYRSEALRLICCLSPFLLLLLPLVTHQQLGAGGERCRAQLAAALQQTTLRLRTLLSRAAAAAASAAASVATEAAEGENGCCRGACCFSVDVEKLFGLRGTVGQTSGAAAAMPLSLAAWAFRVLDWGAAEQLLGQQVLAAADREHSKTQQEGAHDRAAAACAAAATATAATAGQKALLHVLLRRERMEDLHSPTFLLSLPSPLLQQGPYTFLVACCFMAETLHDRQQAFAAVNVLVAASPAAALQLLASLHFAALRPPTTPIVHALLRWKAGQKQMSQRHHHQEPPLFPDELILFDGEQALAARALDAAGDAETRPALDSLPSAEAERWQLLRSLSRVFALSLHALASLGLHKTAVLPAYRALHDLLPLQQQLKTQETQKHPQLSYHDEEWLQDAVGLTGHVQAQALLCCHRPNAANDNGVAATCSRCCCCMQCCWCRGDPLGLLASCTDPISPRLLLSSNGRWFLLMRSLTRLSAYDELPHSKLAAAAPAEELQQGNDEGCDTTAAATAADAGGVGTLQAGVVQRPAVDAAVACVPFVLPRQASPLQQLLLAFCLQQLEAVCPSALLQFLPAMEQLVAACGPSPPLQQQQEHQQQQQWLLARACGITLSILGRLCMRRFLESSKILRVLRRKCAFLFNSLHVPHPALEGVVLVLYAQSQDLAEQIEKEQQEEQEDQQHQPQKRTDSGLSPELEAQVQGQLLLLEEVAEAGSPFARSVALLAASLILGPLYAASVEAASGVTVRPAAGEGISVRFACNEGIGGVVLHLPLRQLEVRGAAALLTAAMVKERVARGAIVVQTPTELLRQQQQHKIGSLLSRNASAAATQADGDAQSERALLRLLLFSKPRTSGSAGGAAAHEARELKELRAHAHQEARDIARHFVTSDPLLLALLPRLCTFFVRRFRDLLPAAVAADGELLHLGQQLLQQLDSLLPCAPTDEENAAVTSGPVSADLPSVHISGSAGIAGLGLRLSEFSVMASLLSALASQQPSLIPAVMNFFSLRLHASAASPPPPWLSSCLLLAFAPLHATTADVSELWREPQEGQKAGEVFAAILQGAYGHTSPAVPSSEVQKCLGGGASKAANDLLAAGRCIFLAAHAQRYSGDRLRLESCLQALLAACAPIGTPPPGVPTGATAGAEGIPADVTAALAVAIAEVSRVVHLQTPDPAYFYPQLLELYRNLETVLLCPSGSQSSRWNALLALGSVLPILLEAGALPLDEAIYFLQLIEEILEQVQPESSALAYAGLAHLTHSLLPLLLLLQRRRMLQRRVRLQQQTDELQRLLLHFEDVVQRWLAAPAVGAASQLARGFAAAALVGAPFLLLPPTQAAAAQRNAGASMLTCVSFALCGVELPPGPTAGDHQQQHGQQQLKQRDASAAAVDRLMGWLSGRASNTSLISFGGHQSGQPSRATACRLPDLAGSMILSLLYIGLTNHIAEGSLASLPEKSLTRLALQQLLQIREGQELLLPEAMPPVDASWPGGAAGGAAPAPIVSARGDSLTLDGLAAGDHFEGDVGEVGEALGWMELVAGRGSQKESSGGSGLPVPHFICLLEALACRGVPAFSELQLGRRLALLFARSMEATTAVLSELISSKGRSSQQQTATLAVGAVDDAVGADASTRSHHLLQQLQACCSLQVGVMRFCCRHCDRLPQFVALFVEFAHSGFGIAAAAAAQQQRQQQRQRRFTAAVAYYFFALLPAAAGALSAQDLSSLLGSILLRGLLPPAREPLLWCSALNALRRILESARRGVCCSGRETQQRKRWEQQQQQQQHKQRRRRFSQVESEVPLYVFPSVSHKLRFFREMWQLTTLWILPLLTGTNASAEDQRAAASSSTEPPASAIVLAAAAARKVPFAVWGTAAATLVAFLLLRKDCLLVQAALNEDDVASLPTAELQNRRRQRFALQQEQEERQLLEQLSLLPAVVVVYLVLSGAAPLELLHQKRRMLLVQLQPSPAAGSDTQATSPAYSTAAGMNQMKVEPPAAATQVRKDDEPSGEDDLTAEVAAFCYACSWLPHKEQVELLEALACSRPSGGNKTPRDSGISALRCFVGFVILAAQMVAPHHAALVLPAMAEADAFTTGSMGGTSSDCSRLSLDRANGRVAGLAASHQGCACQWMQNCRSGGLSLCGELAAFPLMCDDVVEREDSMYAQVAESRFLYTSQQGIKHLILLHHRWLCSIECGSSNHECCCCSPSCYVGSKHPLPQLVLGAADGLAFTPNQCLEPLLLMPAAFAGARGFYCLNFVPNLYHLSSLRAHPIHLHTRSPAAERAPAAPAAPASPGSARKPNTGSINSKVDAAGLCNELAAEYEASVRQQKKAIYGDECHEEIILERRDAILLQSHLPSPLMERGASCGYLGGLTPTFRRSHATAGTLLASTEALAPTVVRLLLEEGRRTSSCSPTGAVASDSGRPGGSLPERLRLLGARLQRILTETQATQDDRALFEH